MNAGVEILLQRLKDCPEDFEPIPTPPYNTVWNNLLNQALEGDFLTKQEIELLNSTVLEFKRNNFTEKVMKTLVGEDEPSDEGKWLAKQRVNAMGTGGQTTRLSSVNPNGVQSVWSNPIPTIGNGGTGASTVIQLGNEVLDENVLRKIKRKLGI
jgi:hypothetical protein